MRNFCHENIFCTIHSFRYSHFNITLFTHALSTVKQWLQGTSQLIISLFFLVDSSVFHFHCFYLCSISILNVPQRPSRASHWTQCKAWSLCMAQESLLVILSTMTVPCVPVIKIAFLSVFQVHSSFGDFMNAVFFIRNDPTSCLIFNASKIKFLFTSSSWGDAPTAP